MKLPLQRIPYSGSTDSYIKDADGKDIARVSPDGLYSPQGHPAVAAYPDEVADQIVRAVNNEHRIGNSLKVIEWLSAYAESRMPKAALIDCLASLSDEVLAEVFETSSKQDDGLRVLASVRRWNNKLERDSVNAKLEKLAQEKS